MATLTDLIARVTNLLGTDPHLTTAEVTSLAQTRYEHLYETFWHSGRTRDFVISLVAQVSSGTSDTVTVTNGSATVTSAGTPFTAAMNGRQIQLGAEPQYFFVNYSSTSVLTLEDGEGTAVFWPGASDAAASWRIFQTLYTLPAAADGVLSLAHDAPLDEYDGGRSALDDTDPNRATTADVPHYWLYAGVDSSNVKQLEVWPVPTSASLLRGQYLRKAPTLAGGTTIDMSLPWLTYAITADACGVLHAKTGDETWKHQQLFYERKSQEVGKDVVPIELERLSLPRSIGRHPRGRYRQLGNDHNIAHHTEDLG